MSSVFHIHVPRIYLLFSKRFQNVRVSVADPDPGSGAFFGPGSGIRDGKKSGSGIRNEHPRSFSESLETVFWVLDPGSFRPWIQNPGLKKFGSEINIPDLQHWPGFQF